MGFAIVSNPVESRRSNIKHIPRQFIAIALHSLLGPLQRGAGRRVPYDWSLQGEGSD